MEEEWVERDEIYCPYCEESEDQQMEEPIIDCVNKNRFKCGICYKTYIVITGYRVEKEESQS